MNGIAAQWTNAEPSGRFISRVGALAMARQPARRSLSRAVWYRELSSHAERRGSKCSGLPEGSLPQAV